MRRQPGRRRELVPALLSPRRESRCVAHHHPRSHESITPPLITNVVNASAFESPYNQPLSPDECADRITAAALLVFGRMGYAEASLVDVARAARVSLTTLLRHYASKDEVFREVVRSTLIGGLSTRHDAAVPADEPSASDAVRALARRYWSTMEEPELAMVVRLVMSELPRFPELAVFHATETLERVAHTLERIIDRGVARGEFRPADTRAAARIIVATLAAHALWFAYPDIYGGVTGQDREQVMTTTIDTLIHALLPIDAEPSGPR